MKVDINIDMNKKYYPILTDDTVTPELASLELLSKNLKISDEVMDNAKVLLKSVFPNSTTDHANLDNPDIILVQAPAWGAQTVPFSLSTLSAYVREKGYKILPLDLNIEFYHRRKEKHDIMWNVDQSQWFWANEDCVNDLLSDHEQHINDFIELIVATNTPIVGFSLYNSSLTVSLYLIKLLKARKPELKIIVGGPEAHHTLAGNKLAENPLIDGVAQSEGEETLIDIIQRVRTNRSLKDCPGLLVFNDGKVVKTSTRPMISKIDTLPIPDFSDYRFDAYVENYKIPMASSRGCPNKCVYCTEQPYWESFRFRSSESMFNEAKYQLEKYPNATFIDFQDSLINGKVSAIEGFAELLMENKIKVQWGGQAVIRKEMTEKLLIKLKMGGCSYLAYGLETPNPDLMRNIGKFLSKGADMDTITAAHARSGLNAVYNVMFGLPGESEEDAFSVLEFVRKNANHNLFVNPSAGFCGFSEGTPGWENPDKFGIDLALGGTFWKSKDGKNTFLTRLKRFEDFCKLVDELGVVHTTYPHTHLLNRNQMIAQYHVATGNPEKAIYYYEKWINETPEDETAINFLKNYRLSMSSENKNNVYHYPIADVSNSEWLNGIARGWGSVILFEYKPIILNELTVGTTIQLANGEKRKIVEIKNPDNYSILAFVDGDPLDGNIVGWPNLITVETQ
jgi:radical SAM superfamily enzyme YgiQ (UPF0313 family)